MVANLRALHGLSASDVIGNIGFGGVGGGTATLTRDEIVEDVILVQPYFDAAWQQDMAAAQVQARLRPIGELAPGWNSYRARPVTSQVLHAAKWLLTQFVLQGIPFPSLVPISHGGLTLEWTSPGREFAITLSGDRDLTMTAFYADEAAGTEWEVPLAGGDERVSGALQELRSELPTY